MVILPTIEFLNAGSDPSKFSQNKDALNIIYNEKTRVCISRNYLSLVEKEIDDINLFQALIRELHDQDRLVVEQDGETTKLSEEFKHILDSSEISNLIPICTINSQKICDKSTNIVVLAKAEKKSRHWVCCQLLLHGFCTVSYFDFTNEKEIDIFFDDLYRVPKKLTEIIVFDREVHAHFLSPAKGQLIKYYTLANKRNQNLIDLREAKRQLTLTIGKKVHLFYIGNSRMIHERKIIFNNI